MMVPEAPVSRTMIGGSAGRPRCARWALLLLACLAASPAKAAADASAADAAYRIIVNPANHETNVDRSFVAQAFLKKVRTWSGGAVIQPVDLTRSAPSRQIFTSDILGRSTAAVRNYWQQMIF